MSAVRKREIESYRFHHIDVSKCRVCKTFDCEETCFRGIYEVYGKGSIPKCTVVREREDRCIKCHICTSACKLDAITID
ncbi:MAG: 4Fe-4S binding protein [Promethearchaeota archaeon]